jgi:hypothetical protein
VLVAVLDVAGQRRHVILKACRGGTARRGTAGCAVRISVPRRSGWRTWLPLPWWLAGHGTGLLRWS